MTPDVYQRLAKFLDNLPGGFPPTESGVELRILRRLFAPDEAELAMHLSLIPEEPRVIALRAGIPVDEVARRLAEMEKKGLVYAVVQEGRPPLYMATQYVIGVYEFQVGKLTPELVRDFEQYKVESSPAFIDNWRKTPQLRVIPVGESIPVHLDVMSYEQAEALVAAQNRFAVAPCICRQEQQVAGHQCEKPLETCLSMGMAADYYVRNGMARTITREDAIGLIRLADESGLVLQPGNSKDADFMCMCCGCCCGVLTQAKRHPRPASVLSSPFHAWVDAGTCDGCGTCTTRCQMDAIRLGDDLFAAVDLDRCIGCGLCVSTCPTDSVRLIRKPEDEQPYVPRDIVETTIRLGQARGKLRMRNLVAMQVQSKADRLRAK
jgi:ferredoxin